MIPGRFARASLFLAALVLSNLATAAASITTLGGAFPERPANWNAVAFDTANQVHLAILAGHPVSAKFLNRDGAVASPAFAITAANEGFTGWASVAFGSASDPAFLVTYVVNFAGQPCTHHKYGRIVRYNGGSPTVSARIFITNVGCQWNFSERAQSVWTGAAWVVGTQVDGPAYNFPFATAEVRLVDPSGGVSPTALLLGDPANPDYYGAPSIACKADGSVCMASGFAGGVAFGGGGVATYARLFDGRNLAPVSAAFYVDNHLSNQQNQHVVYNTSTDQFVAIWWRAGFVSSRTVNPAGAMGALKETVLACAPCGASGPFAGDINAAFNPATGSTLLVTKQFPADLYAFEIDDNGTQLSGPLLVTGWDGKWPEYGPSISVDPVNGRWFVTAVETTGRALLIQGASAVGPPVVTTHPISANARHGDVVTFTAAASGGPAPTIQWQVKAPGAPGFTNIANATGGSLVLTAQRNNSGSLYRALFSNASASNVASTAAALFVLPPTRNDFDGDGKSDALVWRPSNATWYWATSSLTNSTTPVKQWGMAGDISLTGDFDGDAVADLVIWRPSEGTWYWLTSSNGYAEVNKGALHWGMAGDIPIVADMDGDGLSDFVTWRPSTGNWMWLTSSSGFNLAEQGSVHWGTAGDVPLTGDFDGDGKADLAIWRPWEGMWYYLTSSTGYDYGSQKLKLWGAPGLGDRPFVGDFDGDRIADFAIWRASNGTWYWLMSSTGYSYQFARGVQWGNPIYGDIPLLNDFDGDGRSDLVVWRESTGVWFWLPSRAGYAYAAQRSQLFGGPGDIPIVR